MTFLGHSSLALKIKNNTQPLTHSLTLALTHSLTFYRSTSPRRGQPSPEADALLVAHAAARGGGHAQDVLPEILAIFLRLEP